MIKNILFDFDGVIIDSMPIREAGFRLIFQDFDKYLVDRLIDYHNQNGGLSRYVKIDFFFNNILKKPIQKDQSFSYAKSFSDIMKKELVKREYLIIDSLFFIKSNYKKYNLHIVSGSDEEELQYLCNELGIATYFHSIHGSPTVKSTLVKKILLDNNYNMNETILIGDSINDLDASNDNGIKFYGYNNLDLRNLSDIYLQDYKGL